MKSIHMMSRYSASAFLFVTMVTHSSDITRGDIAQKKSQNLMQQKRQDEARNIFGNGKWNSSLAFDCAHGSAEQQGMCFLAFHALMNNGTHPGAILTVDRALQNAFPDVSPGRRDDFKQEIKERARELKDSKA